MTNQRICSYSNAPARQRGVTLIELMVALVLGLVLSGAALALFMTNRQTYIASENMDRIQEASRVAFELMSRDLREADGNPCKNNLLLRENKLSNINYAWWSNWGAGSSWNNWKAGLRGYDGTQAFSDDSFGTSAKKRVSGTPAIESWSAAPIGSVVKVDQVDAADDLDVTSTAASNISAGDILFICDYLKATIFQASAVTTNKIEHHTGGTPGNGSGDLTVNAVDGKPYLKNSVISKLHPVRWYIGYNGRKDQDGNNLTSLYRTTLNSGADQNPEAAEIVPDVTAMELKYLVNGGSDYTTTAPASWGDVVSVQVKLTYARFDDKRASALVLGSVWPFQTSVWRGGLGVICG